MSYLFQQDPITEQQLSLRLESEKNHWTGGTTKSAKKHEHNTENKGPTSMYTTINLYTTFPNINKLIESVNVDLQKNKVKNLTERIAMLGIKPQKDIIRVNNGLCVIGVRQLLLHKLKNWRKRCVGMVNLM